MTISMSSASLPVFKAMLGNLSHILDKAAGPRGGQEVRPGRAAVSTGWRRTCCRSRGRSRSPATPPRTAWPGFRAWRRRSSRTTRRRFAELKARIRKTLDYLASGARRAHRRHRGQGDHLPGRPRDDAHDEGRGLPQALVLPNFFFHVTTAYAILRHNGVELGKADYLAGARAEAAGSSLAGAASMRGQPVELGADVGHAARDHHAAGCSGACAPSTTRTTRKRPSRLPRTAAAAGRARSVLPGPASGRAAASWCGLAGPRGAPVDQPGQSCAAAPAVPPKVNSVIPM